jgi:hypothetical protein
MTGACSILAGALERVVGAFERALDAIAGWFQDLERAVAFFRGHPVGVRV